MNKLNIDLEDVTRGDYAVVFMKIEEGKNWGETHKGIVTDKSLFVGKIKIDDTWFNLEDESIEEIEIREY